VSHSLTPTGIPLAQPCRPSVTIGGIDGGGTQPELVDSDVTGDYALMWQHASDLRRDYWSLTDMCVQIGAGRRLTDDSSGATMKDAEAFLERACVGSSVRLSAVRQRLHGHPGTARSEDRRSWHSEHFRVVHAVNTVPRPRAGQRTDRVG